MAFGKRAVGFGKQAVASYLPSSMQRSTTSLLGECWSFLIVSRNATRKKKVLAAWDASLKRVVAVVFIKELWLAYRCPPHKGHLLLQHKGIVSMLRTVQFVNGLPLEASNKWHVHQRVYSSYSANCHICALFINGHRIATNSHIHE